MDKTSQSVRIFLSNASWSGKVILKRGSAGMERNTKGSAPLPQHGLAQPRANVVSTCSMVWKMLRWSLYDLRICNIRYIIWICMMLHESSKVWLVCLVYMCVLWKAVDSCGIVVCFFMVSLGSLRVGDPWVRGRWPSRQSSLRRNLSCKMYQNVTIKNSGNAHGTQTASSISSGLATSQKAPKRFLGRNVNMNWTAQIWPKCGHIQNPGSPAEAQTPPAKASTAAFSWWYLWISVSSSFTLLHKIHNAPMFHQWTSH